MMRSGRCSSLRSRLAAGLSTLALGALFTSCTVTTDLPEPCPEPCEAGPGGVATCVDGRCELQCEEGLEDCDGDVANGCEVDLTSDSAHCGSCERDCQKALCEASTCIPTPVFSEQVSPVSIALDETHVYWVNRGLAASMGTIEFPFGSVHRGSRSNDGVVDTIAADQNFTIGIAVDEAHVYWTAASDGTVNRWALDGTSGAEMFVGSRQLPAGLDVDATHVYVAETAAGRIGRADKATGMLQSLALGQPLMLYVVTHGGHVYWANNEGRAVLRVPVDGGQVETLASELDKPHEIAVTDEYVFVTNSVIERNLPGKLQRIAIASGEIADVTTGSGIVSGVAVVGDMVYYGEATPLFSLKRRPIDLSGPPETLISDLNSITDIIGDENGVYFLALNDVYFYPPEP